MGIAGKLHTGRSRNDQVGTGMRLWLRDELRKIETFLVDFLKLITSRAEAEISVLMPGYTHLQRAQPIRALAPLIQRRLRNRPRTPTPTHPPRESLPSGRRSHRRKPLWNRPRSHGQRPRLRRHNLELDGRSCRPGFRRRNPSVGKHAHAAHQSVGGRSDPLLDCGVRLCPFGRSLQHGQQLDATEEESDSLELLRVKSGRVFGHMAGLMYTIKGLPSTNNKDLQESFEPMLDGTKTIGDSVQIATGVLSTMAIFPEKMRQR